MTSVIILPTINFYRAQDTIVLPSINLAASGRGLPDFNNDYNEDFLVEEMELDNP